MSDNLLFRLREGAKFCSNVARREALMATADHLQDAINVFSENINDASLAELQSIWSLARRVAGGSSVPPGNSPPTDSVKPELERLAA